MRRIFALLGFTSLLALIFAVFLGAVPALLLCDGCLIAFGVLVLAFRKRFDLRIPAAILLTAALSFASFYTYHQQKIQPMEQLDGQTVLVTGHLCEPSYEAYQRHYYILELESVTQSDGTPVSIPSGERIRLSTQQPLDLTLDSQLTGTVQLYQPSGEDGFNSRSAYAAKGITLFGYLYEYEPYQIEKQNGVSITAWPSLIREGMTQSLHTLLPKGEANLLSAALLGDRTVLDDTVKEQFVDCGLYHILVVSGFHVSLIALFILRILRRIPIPRAAKLFTAMLAVVAFMAITGFSYSVLRSGIMILLLLLGRLLFRQADPLNSLGASIFLICFFQPYAVADFGFLLSVASTTGILLLAPKLESAWENHNKRQLWRRHFPQSLHWLSARIRSILCVSTAASVFSLPLMILAGNTVSLIAPLTNVLLLLPASWMLQLGLGAALLQLLPGFAFFAQPMGLLSGLLAKFLLWATKLLSEIPFASVATGQGVLVVWVAASLILLAYLLIFFHKKIGYLVGAILSVCLLLVAVFSNLVVQTDTLRISILDVGSGLSVVISKNGSAAVLGCEGYRSDLLLSYLEQEQIQKITYLQLVSYTPEEKKNAAALLSAYPIEQILLEDSVYFSGSLQRAVKNGTAVSYYKNQAQVTLLDDVTVWLEGSCADNGLWFSVNDMTFLLLSDTYDTTKSHPLHQDVDFLISDGLPDATLEGAYLTTILSMPEDEVQLLEGKASLDFETVNLYTTGGRGTLQIDVHDNRTVTMRRET